MLVAPAGGKWWRLKYRIDNKGKLLSLSIYPDVSLKEARRRRDDARELIAKGIDPSAERKEAEAAAIAEQCERVNTFETVAMDWYTSYSPDLSERQARKLCRLLEKALLPAIGSKSVTALVPADILDATRPVQDQGKISTAHDIVRLAGQILQYAFIKRLVPVNVGLGITGALRLSPIKD